MSGALSGGIRSVSAVIRSAPIPLTQFGHLEPPPRRASFVTVSREGGAGGHTIGQRLAARLNELDPGPEPWTLWDRQLVEKVATDHHIAKELVDSLEDSNRTWMQDFLAGFSMKTEASEDAVYRSVATTMRALAQRGRAILVGRGGVYITHRMTGGVHLRLVAPFEFRVRNMARQLGMDETSAANYVRHLDHQRKVFYRRYWPREIISSEAFTLTINTAAADEDRAVESVIPFILQASHVAPTGPATNAIIVGT
jgi:cytidylate kinase